MRISQGLIDKIDLVHLVRFFLSMNNSVLNGAISLFEAPVLSFLPRIKYGVNFGENPGEKMMILDSCSYWDGTLLFHFLNVNGISG